MDTRKRDIKVGGISFACILFLVFATNPGGLPIALLLAMPLLSGVFVWAIIRVGLDVFMNLDRRQIEMAGLLGGAGFTVIMALGSIHQLGIQDVVLTVLLLGGLLFYSIGAQTQER